MLNFVKDCVNGSGRVSWIELATLDTRTHWTRHLLAQFGRTHTRHGVLPLLVDDLLVCKPLLYSLSPMVVVLLLTHSQWFDLGCDAFDSEWTSLLKVKFSLLFEKVCDHTCRKLKQLALTQGLLLRCEHYLRLGHRPSVSGYLDVWLYD